MSFSYNSTAPGSSSLSWVRMRVGDTSSGSYQVENEEIDAILDTEGNKYLAAAVVAESMGARNASKVDRRVGSLSISGSQGAGNYFTLARRLRFEAAMRSAPYAGGISESDKADVEADTDRVQPSFSVGQFDDPATAAIVDLSTLD